MIPKSESTTGLCLLLAALAAVGCHSRDETLEPPSIAAALAGFATGEPIAATLETSEGAIRCTLDPSRAPHGVALFVGLATGRAAWIDPATGAVTRRPLYANLTFHRAVPGVMVQTGDPVGDSTGHPGYRIAVETAPDDADRLSRPGALLLARYTPPPGRADPHPPPPGRVLGSQFAVTLTNMSHLVGQVSVIGRCEDLRTVERIAEQTSAGGRARLTAVRVRQNASAR